MTEQVLVFPTELVKDWKWKNGWIKVTKQKLKYLLYNNSKLEYKDRDLMEKDPTYLQLIPYCVLHNDKGFFAYPRTKKGGEQRLHDKWSIGIGGHLNPIDGVDGNFYSNGLTRELKEEVGLELQNDEVFETEFFLYDPKDSVGSVHIGAVHFIEVSNDFRPHKLDQSIGQGDFETLVKLKENANVFEGWSQILIKENLLNDYNY